MEVQLARGPAATIGRQYLAIQAMRGVSSLNQIKCIYKTTFVAVGDPYALSMINSSIPISFEFAIRKP